MSKPALGKGLGALIAPKPQSLAAAPHSGDRIMRLPLDQIVPTPLQPRKHFRPEAIADLVHSIKSHGILQPLVVRKAGDTYELIAGERRWRAAKEAGLKEAPALVREASDLEVLELALIENLQREDLNPIEEALAYQRLASDFNLTQETIAEKVGKSRATVANSMRLLDLHPQVRTYVEHGQLSVGHAKVLLALKDPGQQLALAEIVIRQSATVRATEKLLAERLSQTGGNDGKRPQRRIQTLSPAIVHVQNKLREHLSTHVAIQHSEKKGRIEIEYYGGTDLQRILDKLGIPPDAI